jgi:hypothetical protein
MIKRTTALVSIVRFICILLTAHDMKKSLLYLLNYRSRAGGWCPRRAMMGQRIGANRSISGTW